MRAVALLAVWAAGSAPAPAPPSPPTPILEDVPAVPDPGSRYLIYLHGRIIEQQGRKAVSPDFGRYEYDAILEALAARGFTVIAEVRSGDAGEAFVDKVAGQVRRLLRAGVPAAHVTVAGFSRGGGLAVAVSAKAAEPEVSYVVMAGCSQDPEWVARWAPAVRGRLLSLYDRADRFKPSCAPLFAKARGLGETREVELSTGLDHGLFYAPRPEWLEPLDGWARRAPPRPSPPRPPAPSRPGPW